MNSVSSRRGANSPAMVITVLLLAAAAFVFVHNAHNPVPAGFISAGLLVLAAIMVSKGLLMARQWERAIVLRLGKLKGVHGPGLFLIIPFVDEVSVWVDQRIQTTEFNAEQALSKDTVPVDVDAVIFWQIHDPERAALEITDYRSAIERVAQTSLREMVGSSLLSSLLSDRKHGDAVLLEEIGRKTGEWGVTAISVEIRDISVPDALQDAMSREAQAQREGAARLHLGQAEKEVAQKFVEAAEIYAQSPTALQLRAMNIIYETTKERGATILMPSAMVDAMNPAGLLAASYAIQPAAAAAAPEAASRNPAPSRPAPSRRARTGDPG
ncbi:MAG TPA: slipin family protein [Caulobacteraceae bacterium]|jgi:regulator of protease activity HflC (stomatin/prohibitin superfamily)